MTLGIISALIKSFTWLKWLEICQSAHSADSTVRKCTDYKMVGSSLKPDC